MRQSIIKEYQHNYCLGRVTNKKIFNLAFVLDTPLITIMIIKKEEEIN